MDDFRLSLSKGRRKKNEEQFKAFNVANRQVMEAVMDEDSKRSFPLGLTCECSDPNCSDRIELTVDQRKRIRRDPNAFIIVPKHLDDEIEKVIERHDSYALVKKFEDL